MRAICVVKPMIKNELVSKVRPEARWSYYNQDYKSPNGLSLQRYPKNYGKYSERQNWPR